MRSNKKCNNFPFVQDTVYPVQNGNDYITYLTYFLSFWLQHQLNQITKHHKNVPHPLFCKENSGFLRTSPPSCAAPPKLSAPALCRKDRTCAPRVTCARATSSFSSKTDCMTQTVQQSCMKQRRPCVASQGISAWKNPNKHQWITATKVYAVRKSLKVRNKF